MSQLPVIALDQLPDGWAYGIKRSIAFKGDRKIYATTDDRGSLGYVIADQGGWLPGVFTTLPDALKAFEEYPTGLPAAG